MSQESLSGRLARLALVLVLVAYTTYVFLTSALAFGAALDAGPVVGKALWEIRFIAETFVNFPVAMFVGSIAFAAHGCGAAALVSLVLARRCTRVPRRRRDRGEKRLLRPRRRLRIHPLLAPAGVGRRHRVCGEPAERRSTGLSRPEVRSCLRGGAGRRRVDAAAAPRLPEARSPPRQAGGLRVPRAERSVCQIRRSSPLLRLRRSGGARADAENPGGPGR
jgi:hypothetical protein